MGKIPYSIFDMIARSMLECSAFRRIPWTESDSMSRSIQTLWAMLLLSLTANCQDAPASQQGSAPAGLDRILAAWEARTSKIESLTTKCRRTTIGFVRKEKTVYVGESGVSETQFRSHTTSLAKTKSKRTISTNPASKGLFSPTNSFTCLTRTRESSLVMSVPLSSGRKMVCSCWADSLNSGKNRCTIFSMRLAMNASS